MDYSTGFSHLSLVQALILRQQIHYVLNSVLRSFFLRILHWLLHVYVRTIDKGVKYEKVYYMVAGLKVGKVVVPLNHTRNAFGFK